MAFSCLLIRTVESSTTERLDLLFGLSQRFIVSAALYPLVCQERYHPALCITYKGNAHGSSSPPSGEITFMTPEGLMEFDSSPSKSVL